MAKYSMHLLVCGGSSCSAKDSERISHQLNKELIKQGLDETVQVIMSGCFGLCENGPVVKVVPDGTLYVQVKPEDAEEIVEQHVIRGKKVERLISSDQHRRIYRKGWVSCSGKCADETNSRTDYRSDQGVRFAGKGRSRFSDRTEVGICPTE